MRKRRALLIMSNGVPTPCTPSPLSPHSSHCQFDRLVIVSAGIAIVGGRFWSRTGRILCICGIVCIVALQPAASATAFASAALCLPVFLRQPTEFTTFGQRCRSAHMCVRVCVCVWMWMWMRVSVKWVALSAVRRDYHLLQPHTGNVIGIARRVIR